MSLAHPKPTPREKSKPKPLRRSRLKRVPVALKRGKGIRQRSNSELSKLIRLADRLFADLVKRPGRCRLRHRRCFGPLDTAHHVSRTFSAVRWDLDNASPLCRHAHRYYTDRPAAWARRWRRWIGDAKADRVEQRAREGMRLTVPVMECIVAGLKAAGGKA